MVRVIRYDTARIASYTSEVKIEIRQTSDPWRHRVGRIRDSSDYPSLVRPCGPLSKGWRFNKASRLREILPEMINIRMSCKCTLE